MIFTSPYTWLTKTAERNAIIILFVLALLIIVSLQKIGNSLKNQVAPHGIVSFELSKTLQQANSILNSWNHKAKIDAALSLGIDYLFLFVYPLLISLLCHRLAMQTWKEQIRFVFLIGIILSWLQFLAGFLDAIENYFLIQLLIGSMNTFWPKLAYWSAISKFVIIIFGIGYVIMSVVFNISRKVRH